MFVCVCVCVCVGIGVESVEWTLSIVDDGVRETNDEKLKLFLENATNAVIGHVDKTQIQLVDFHDGP